MSAHTPGPWFGRPHHDPVMISGSSEVGLEIAFSCAGAGSRREEYKANARLIAAAPDLLSSHGRLLANFRLLLAGKPVRDVAEMYAEAEAAIVKATGATP